MYKSILTSNNIMTIPAKRFSSNFF